MANPLEALTAVLLGRRPSFQTPPFQRDQVPVVPAPANQPPIPQLPPTSQIPTQDVTYTGGTPAQAPRQGGLKGVMKKLATDPVTANALLAAAGQLAVARPGEGAVNPAIRALSAGMNQLSLHRQMQLEREAAMLEQQRKNAEFELEKRKVGATELGTQAEAQRKAAQTAQEKEDLRFKREKQEQDLKLEDRRVKTGERQATVAEGELEATKAWRLEQIKNQKTELGLSKDRLEFEKAKLKQDQQQFDRKQASQEQLNQSTMSYRRALIDVARNQASIQLMKGTQAMDLADQRLQLQVMKQAAEDVEKGLEGQLLGQDPTEVTNRIKVRAQELFQELKSQPAQVTPPVGTPARPQAPPLPAPKTKDSLGILSR